MRPRQDSQAMRLKWSRDFMVSAFLIFGVCFFGLNTPNADESSGSATKTKPCMELDTLARIACQDSVIQEMARRDSLLKEQSESARTYSRSEDDASAVESERTSNYFFGFMSDWGQHGLIDKDFAKALYVVAAVVVVGGTLIYLPVMLYKLVRNEESDPIRQEVAFGYTYSGANWEGGGQPIYRNTSMPGMRYSLIVAHPVVALGVTVEGGYFASSLEGSLLADPASDLRGAYGLLGPMLRFGAQAPVHFSLEFLNGMSSAEAIGWISKARANLQMELGSHALIGLNAGSLFYDMHFFDGTVWRQGNFNRDLSLSIGVDAGYRF